MVSKRTDLECLR